MIAPGCEEDIHRAPTHPAAELAAAVATSRRLEAELEETVRELATTYHELALAYKALEAAGTTETHEHMAGAVLNRATEAVGALGGAFLVADKDQAMSLLAAAAVSSEDASSLRDTALARLDNAPWPGLPFSFELKERHYLACPIQHEGRRLGLIVVFRPAWTPFTSREGKLLQATGRQAALAMRNRDLVNDLRGLFLSTVQALVAAIEAKDAYTCGHSRRVAELAHATAMALGLKPDLVEDIHIAAVVHDVGKIGVDTSILRKPGRLDEGEWHLVREHPDRGAGIIGCIPQLQRLIGAVRHHHERIDGSGYPAGLAGNEIPLGARIIAVCDTYDAITSARPYRSAGSHQDACRELLRCEGTQVDPAVTEAFLRIVAT